MAPLDLGVAFARSIPIRLLPFFTDFSDFLVQIILVIVEVVFTVDYLYHMHVFFSGIVLWRNCYIKNVVLFEEKSILVFPECLEAC